MKFITEFGLDFDSSPKTPNDFRYFSTSIRPQNWNNRNLYNSMNKYDLCARCMWMGDLYVVEITLKTKLHEKKT